ncbi:hypothetical protein BP5796_01877 [Coleophoma crateriformis]|uniref:Alpha/beta hydrolase fold-3 domain-containing protein n=1 Tax=Coleophoma crateriformis TaxID=565419 RepID=A0A3D8T1N7_9HELO|nr:hypothetical protein BP5796_01877 [Coleophoma crateriformis]
MDPALFLTTPPPLDPAWVAHEQANDLWSIPRVVDIKENQKVYSQTCKRRNAQLLASRDEHLIEGLVLTDSKVLARDSYLIPIRTYHPAQHASEHPDPQSVRPEDKRRIIVYYHGGGLKVGDLDSEDLSCRRLCKGLGCTVYSVEYRLLPDFTADQAIDDAIDAFGWIMRICNGSRLIVVGSSSGGHLAAQVSQHYKHASSFPLGGKSVIHGVCLRSPVTCDPYENGEHIPQAWKRRHHSMSPAFYTSIQARPMTTPGEKAVRHALPLEAESFEGLPRTFCQLTTNDVYYSDGICYAAALMEAGVEVRLDIVKGWPHTFWLKAPLLERAEKAERDFIAGVRWLLEAEGLEEPEKVKMSQRFIMPDKSFQAMDPGLWEGI